MVKEEILRIAPEILLEHVITFRILASEGENLFLFSS